MVDGNTEEVDGIDDDSIYEELGLDELGGAEESGGKGDEATPASTPATQDSKEAAKAPDVKDAKKSKKEMEKEEKEAKEREKEKKKERERVTTTELPSINAAAKLAPPPKPGKEPPKPVAAVPVAKAAPPPVLPSAPSVRGKAAAQVPLAAQPPARGARGVQAEQAGLMARAGLPAPPQVGGGVLAQSRLNKDGEPPSLGTAPTLGVPKQPPGGGVGGLPPPTARVPSSSHDPPSGAVASQHSQQPPTGLPPPVPRASAVVGLPSALSSLDGSGALASGSHSEDVGLPPSIPGSVGLAASSEDLASARQPAADEHEAGGLHSHSLVPGGGQSAASRAGVADATEDDLSLGEDHEIFEELTTLVAEAASST